MTDHKIMEPSEGPPRYRKSTTVRVDGNPAVRHFSIGGWIRSEKIKMVRGIKSRKESQLSDVAVQLVVISLKSDSILNAYETSHEG